MNPGLVVKLRPTGPWRIGPDSGARNKVDAIYHSDSLYGAVTSAIARLGSLAEWLDATVKASAPAVSFSSCFPFLDEIGFVTPPRTVWPPTAPGMLAARLRWKSARFVPLGIVPAILAGERLDDSKWAVDGPSACLVPAGRPGPFRTELRSNAAVDRLTGAAERHSTACLEFRPGAGLWTVVSFADEAARDRWSEPLKAAFRWLADSGFGGERSRGWGRSEAPEFIEGVLPEMIYSGARGRGPAAGAEPAPVEPAPVAPEPAASEPAASEPEEPSPVPPVEPPPQEPPTAPVEEPPAEEPPATEPPAPPEETPEPEPLDEASQREKPDIAGFSMSPDDEAAEAPRDDAESDRAAETDAQPAPAEAEPDAAAQPEPEPPEPESLAAEPTPELSAEPPAQPEPEPQQSEPAAAESAPGPRPPAPEVEAPWPPAPEKAPLPAYWLLSLYTPAADDTVDWSRGNYAVVHRGGRVDTSGELKKQIAMIAEGSVLLAATAPRGAAPEVAPEDSPHPVYRAGFAVAIPLGEVS